MRIFQAEAEEHRAHFESQGWVHMPGGCSEEFLGHLVALARHEARTLELAGHRGSKDQFRYIPPPDVALRDELFGFVSALSGVAAESLTLSECHLNVYDDDAPEEPPPHKDRYASQFTVGISVDVPSESSLVLYPYDHRELNRFFTSAQLRESLDPDELPEVVLQGSEEVEIHDRPGDVVVFPGSSMWHHRRHSANPVFLYLKCNDFDCDPLQEDDDTALRRKQTESLVVGDDPDLDGVTPVLSRRLEWTAPLAGRDWNERYFAKLWESSPFPLSEVDYRIVRAIDGRTEWGKIAAALGHDHHVLDLRLLRLARRGAVDLLPAPGLGV